MVSEVVITGYLTLLGLLCIFGAHRLHLTWLYLCHQRGAPLPSPGEAQPFVTVQLPLYNERFVAERLIRAACALQHPRDRLEVQVLDDSTDETRRVVDLVVAELRSQGHPVAVLRRASRTGYKAGALAEGLKEARGSLIAVFDADFLPRPDFLRRLIPYFAQGEVGMVQARWGHLNREHGLLSRLQATLLDGHFYIEHTARNRSGRFFNFNGTAGIWRREAIDEAGGWQGDTLTEDLDLSYRAQLKGWRFVYEPRVEAPAELPIDVAAFKNQQHRWAKGSIQTARKLLPRIFRSPIPAKVKVEAAAHLLANLAYPLLFLVALLLPVAAFLRPKSSMMGLLLLDLPVLLMATGSVLFFYGVAERAAGRSLRGSWWLLPLTLALGAGLTINNSKAVLEALLGRRSAFVRTPKRAVTNRGSAGAGAYPVRDGGTAWLELALGLYLLWGVWVAWEGGSYGAIPFLGLFSAGLLYLGGLSLFTARPGQLRAGTSLDGARALAPEPPTERPATARP